MILKDIAPTASPAYSASPLYQTFPVYSQICCYFIHLKNSSSSNNKNTVILNAVTLSIYCPISLLPFTPKLVEEVVYIKVAKDFHAAKFSGWFYSVYLTDQQCTAQSVSSASGCFFTWCHPSFLLDLTISFVIQLLLLPLLEGTRLSSWSSLSFLFSLFSFMLVTDYFPCFIMCTLLDFILNFMTSDAVYRLLSHPAPPAPPRPTDSWFVYPSVWYFHLKDVC